MSLKRVLLLRHAKSDGSSASGMDQDRDLSSSGISDAQRMGRFMAGIRLTPDSILSSPAVRARTTAELAVGAAGWESLVEIRPDFYGGGTDAVMSRLRQLEEGCGTVLLVGHEPIWSASVGGLCGNAKVRFPTAALACLTGGVASWAELDWGAMELRWLLTPTLLERSDLGS